MVYNNHMNVNPQSTVYSFQHINNKIKHKYRIEMMTLQVNVTRNKKINAQIHEKHALIKENNII